MASDTLGQHEICHGFSKEEMMVIGILIIARGMVFPRPWLNSPACKNAGATSLTVELRRVGISLDVFHRDAHLHEFLSLHSKSLHSLLLEAISRNCNAQAVKIAVFITIHTNSFKSEEKVICYQFSLENNLPTFRPNAPVVIRVSQNVGKLFSELKLVTDNLLFIYAEGSWEASWEATESLSNPPAANRLSRHSQCLLYDCLSGLYSSCCERHIHTCTELTSHI